jgi:hypothetical protein
MGRLPLSLKQLKKSCGRHHGNRRAGRGTLQRLQRHLPVLADFCGRGDRHAQSRHAGDVGGREGGRRRREPVPSVQVASKPRFIEKLTRS